MWHDDFQAATYDVAQTLRTKPATMFGQVHMTATIDQTAGPVSIGMGTKVGENTVIRGPVIIGDNVTIGPNVVITGTTRIGDSATIENGAEIEHSIIEAEATIGAYARIADSIVREAATVGPKVITVNIHPEYKTVVVHDDNYDRHDTGLSKLGCEIGEGVNVGAACIIMPGRSIEADSVIGPGVLIANNIRVGRWWLKQELGYRLL